MVLLQKPHLRHFLKAICFGIEPHFIFLQRKEHPGTARLLLRSIAVLARADPDRLPVFAIEEDVRHPFVHARDLLVDPARAEGLEDPLAAVRLAHFF